ncbi:hypothetical protein HOY82DRAFT_640724 [Tuber indicum]|nr:hypothetical protein HOY82DRAFT_640724 [Tuber indicum]
MADSACFPPGLVPMTVASYRFPPSGLLVNVLHCEGCPNTSSSFGESLVAHIQGGSLTLVSELELSINSYLAGSGCPNRLVIRDNTFGLFVGHHTPEASSATSFAQSQSTATQGTGSLVGEQLAAGRQSAFEGTQAFSVGGTTPLPPATSADRAFSFFAGHSTPKRSLQKGIKFHDSADCDYRPARAAVPISRQHTWFLGKAAADPIVTFSPVRDVFMALGGDKTTEGDGLRDSVHAAKLDSLIASGVVEEFVVEDEVDLVGSVPALPSTWAETVCVTPAPLLATERVSTMTPVEVDMFNELEEIQCGQVVPIVSGDDVESVADLPMGLGEGCNSEGSGLGDCRHASPEDSSSPPPDECLIIDQVGHYLDLTDAGRDMSHLAAVVVDLCEAVTGLKTYVSRQDRKIDKWEDLVDSFRRQALGTKAGKKPTAPSPAPAQAPALPRALAPANAPKGPKAKPVLVNKSSGLPLKPAYSPPAVVRPSDIHAPAARSSRTRASWAKTTAPSGGEKEFTVVSRRRIASPPPVLQLTERARCVSVCFENRGSKARLPAGVNPEMVKNALNKALADGGSAAHFGSCVAHRHPASALNEGLRSRMERAVMGLEIGGFSFHPTPPKSRCWFRSFPFLLPVLDWQGETAFDDLVRDLEVNNPGFNVVGRPHWIGSLASHKTHKHVKRSGVFFVERNSAVNAALEKRRVVVFSRRRPLGVWAQIKTTSLCERCLCHGHVAVMCRAHMARKFCDIGHFTAQHSSPIVRCTVPTGSLCTHVRLECQLCSHFGHFPGDSTCPNLHRPSPATSGSSPSSTKVVSEETTKTGITDRSMQKLVKGPQTLAVEVVIAEGAAALGPVAGPSNRKAARISKDAMAALLTELDDSDVISGDFNAQQLSWDTRGCGSGSAVLDYMSGRDMIRQIHGGPTFRGVSTIDLTWSRPGLAIRYASYNGAATEHLAQFFRLEVAPCDDLVPPPIPRKRVDWDVVGEVVDGLGDGLSYQSTAGIVRGLRGPAVRGRTVGWWTEELRVIQRDEGLSGSYG